MNHQEIAKVVMRKAAQRLIDLRARLAVCTGDHLSPEMIRGLAARVQEESWVVGHSFTLDENDTSSGGAVLVVDRRPDSMKDREHTSTLMIEFLGRTPVPPHGGFSADLYNKQGDDLEFVVGLQSWKPSLWADLPIFAALLAEFEGHSPYEEEEEDPQLPGEWA